MRFFHPLILFLDEKPEISASYLSERFLSSNIKNTCQVLVCSILYSLGIRNKKACKYYFSKENKRESIMKFFPDWPMKDSPKFTSYNSAESKWCRKCKNHYDIVLAHFEAALNEYSFRHGKDHELYEMLDFLKMCPYDISVRLGYRVIYIKDLKIVLPWKNLPLKYRKKDIIEGYRQYYSSQIFNPYKEYAMTKRDIPDFILKGRNSDEFQSTPVN